MTNGDAVAGAVTFTMADQARIVASQLRGWRAVVFVLACAGLVLLLAFEPDTEDTADLIALAVVVALALLFVAPILAVARLSTEQKQLRYEISGAQIVIRDATGAALTIPWSTVRAARESGSAFALALKPAGTRWLFKRAFSAADLDRLRARLHDQLGERARLRAPA